MSAPEKTYRKSLAIYYLCTPPIGTEDRGRALFAPTISQMGDTAVEELIKRRSDVFLSQQVYRDETGK